MLVREAVFGLSFCFEADMFLSFCECIWVELMFKSLN